MARGREPFLAQREVSLFFWPTRIRPGTTPLSVCRAQASPGLPPRGRESFFERLHGVCILLVGLGPGAHMREAQVLQGAVDRVVGNRDAKLLVEAHDQITGPPAYDAIDRRDRPFLHETSKKRLVLLGEFAGRTRR